MNSESQKTRADTDHPTLCAIFAIEFAILIVFGFAGVGRIGTYIDAGLAISYFTFTIGGPHGQTPGMHLMGIAVIDEAEGEPAGYPKALLRFFLTTTFMTIVIIPLAIMWFFAIYDEKRQMVHDKAVGTVVIELSAPTSVAQQAATPAAQPARPPAANGVGTAYLIALSGKDVPAIQSASGIVTPAEVAKGVNVLLSASDISRELAEPGNSIGHVSDVVVIAAHTTKAGAATVTLSYHADNDVHAATYSLITSDHSPSGWVVQVNPSRSDVGVPTGDTTVTVDSMPVKLDGEVTHVYLYPSVTSVAVPASAIWQAASTTVDARHQDPSGDPQSITFPDQLLPAAQTSAVQAVADQINNCLAATSLTPANCPNNDVPVTTSQGDSYSGVSWTGLGAPTAGMAAMVDPKSGAVTVSGSETVEVTHTDTTPGASFFGSVSNQQTDGPFNLSFSYPLTWSGSAWVLGTVTAKDTGSTAST